MASNSTEIFAWLGIGAGAFLLDSAIKGRAPLQTLKSIIGSNGTKLTSVQIQGLGVPAQYQNTGSAASSTTLGGALSSLGGSSSGSAIAADALKYNGVGTWAYGKATPTAWDCSGFVNWVLGHDLHMTLPGGVTNFTGANHGPVAAQYYVWSGATTVPRAQCQPGDLCCWMTHIGIAVSESQMMNSYTTGRPAEVTGIDDHCPPGEVTLIRRING